MTREQYKTLSEKGKKKKNILKINIKIYLKKANKKSTYMENNTEKVCLKMRNKERNIR